MNNQTPWRDALAACGLRSIPQTNSVLHCELVDASGTIVFSGHCWPHSWLYMHEEYGLYLSPNQLATMHEDIERTSH